MNRKSTLWALVALNLALIVALTWKFGAENTAHAQVRPARADVLMVPAKLSNSPNGVVYMVDTRNGLLGAFVFDSNRGELINMPPINLNRVFEGAAGPARRP